MHPDALVGNRGRLKVSPHEFRLLLLYRAGGINTTPPPHPDQGWASDKTIEIAWAWLRLQPDSQLSRWYQERFA